MNVTMTGNIPLSKSLGVHTKKSHIFDVLHIASLISLGQLCDEDCIIILDNNEINIIKDSKLTLKKYINKKNGLWGIPVSRRLRHQDDVIIKWAKTKTEMIQYIH